MPRPSLTPSGEVYRSFVQKDSKSPINMLLLTDNIAANKTLVALALASYWFVLRRMFLSALTKDQRHDQGNNPVGREIMYLMEVDIPC